MAKIIDTPPDKIELTENGQHLFYFTRGKDPLMLPIGAKYIVVYEPTIYNAKGRVVMYEITSGPGKDTWAKEIQERELTNKEIAHFEKLAGR